MSSGRGRSWRPANQRSVRDRRKRTVIVLITVLVCLIAAILVPILLPKEPAVQFISLTDSNQQIHSAGIPVTYGSSPSVTQKQLEAPLQALHELNPSQVNSPVFDNKLLGLKGCVKPGEKLVLYCGLEPFVEIETSTQKAVLKLRDVEGASSTFHEMLQLLKNSQASQILLLVDPVIRSPGIIDGDDRSDLVPMIQEAIEDASLKNLVVICACDRQQLSWPYIPKQGSTPPPSEVPNGSAPNRPERFGYFRGTAFGHFFREAILSSACGSADELFQYLTDNMTPWVEETYGQPQTVLLLAARRTASERELLARVQWPAAADFESTAAQKSKKTQEPPEDALSDSVESKDQQQSLRKTPDQLAAEMRSRWKGLRSLEQVAAAAPALSLELSAIILAAESALRQGDEAKFNGLFSKAGKAFDEIEGKLRKVASFRNGTELSPWLTVAPPAELRLPVDSFIDTLAEANDEQSPRLFPRELGRPGSARQQFAEWLFDDLQKLAEVIDAKSSEEKNKLISLRSVFLQKLNGIGWPKEDWPEHFFTIEAILSNGDSEWHAQALRPLTRLLHLRRNALRIATGQMRASGGAEGTESEDPEATQLVRRGVWLGGADKTRSVLDSLLAAERWLAVGPSGYRMAMKSLRKAETDLDSVRDLLHSGQQLVSIRDQQLTELPHQIQFMAQQMEQVPLSDNELLSAEKMADAILSGDGKVQQAFPAALLKPTAIGSREIEAMFALTRSYLSEPAKSEDKAHQQSIDSYLNSQVTAATSSLSRQSLLQIPMLIDRHDDILSGLSSVTAESIDQRQNSGIWLAFWSTRLLEAFTGVQQTSIWNQWKDLITATRTGSAEARQAARLQLVRSLQAGWKQAYSELAGRPESALYVPDEDSVRLIGADLLQRAKVDRKNRIFFKRQAARIANLSFATPNSSLSCADLIALDEENRALLKVSAEGAKFLYISRTELEVQSPSVALEEDWYRLDAKATNEVLFHSSGGMRAPVNVVIAAIDDVGHLLEQKEVTIAPNGRTSWQVAFLNTDGTEQLLRERDLELSPSTRDSKAPEKDQPTPLSVQITQRDGVAKKIEVQCLGADDQPFWPSPQQLVLGEDNSVRLPLSPASNDPATPAGTGSLTINVTDGMRFEITPVDVIGAETTSIPVVPKLALPRKFATRPEPTYDPIRQELSFRLERANNSGIATRQKVPVRIDFSPALGLLRKSSGSPTSIPNLSDQGQTFRYEFENRIRQSFSVNPQSPEQSELEFSVSVAGIPQAWRWKLTENGVRSMSNDQIFIRSELEVANPTEAAPIAGQSKIIIGENWKQAKLNANVFLHGGDFSGEQDPWKLDLRVEDTVSRQQVSVLTNPINVSRRWNQTVSVSPGENGTWNFSTDSQPYGIRDLNLQTFGLQAGRFDLIAVLSQRNDRSRTINHRTPFVYDGSAPVISVDDIKTPGTVSVSQDLTGSIAASDRESNVVGIRVGMSEDKLRPVDIEFGASTGGEFTIRVAEKSFPQITRTDQTEYAVADLIVEVTNGAGLKKTIRKSLKFEAAALPMKVVEKGPAKPGKVVFVWPTKTKYTVTLTGPDGGPQKAVGEGSVEFANLPPGKYRLKWDAGFGPRDHSGSITVQSGKTTTVEK